MKISIGSDHRGYALKQHLIKNFPQLEWIDQGPDSDSRTDYPIYAKRVCEDVLSKRAVIGILICGSGVGMAIAANRNRGIYAANCWAPRVAEFARQDDGVNVLVLPANFVEQDKAIEIVEAWLSAKFKGGRYQTRLEMVDEH